MAKLRPRARIVRTIGDQLISGPEAALIELVKNAYDADSSYVAIEINPPEDELSEGFIVVSDDGHGMTSSDLLEKWLEPATDNKVQNKKSPRQRTLLGAKGIGRFAASRLGSHLILETVSQDSEGSSERSRLVVDWNVFESAKYLDEIDLDIQQSKAEVGAATGVKLTISKLRDAWTKKQLEQLVRELRRLLSPVAKDDATFKIYLNLSRYTQESHGFVGQELVSGWQFEEPTLDEVSRFEVRPFKIQDVYHYRVVGTFDNRGSFIGSFINGRSSSALAPIEIPGPALSDEEQYCGPVALQLNLYDREGPAIQELFEAAGARGIGRLESRRILDESVGLGIYRNGFRIRPYGDADSDWLELERKRVQDPSKRIGLNQVWGLVEVAAERDSGLIERSSREGFEHNGAFIRLKRLLEGVIAHAEAFRLDYRQRVGLSRRKAANPQEVQMTAELRATQRAVADLPDRFRARVQKALSKDKEALKTAIEDLETTQQALASRSTLGLVVSQVLHDGRRFLADIATRSGTLVKGAPRLLEESKFGEHFRATFGKNAMLIQASAADLGRLFKTLDPISGRRRGRAKDFDPKLVIERCLDLFNDAIVDARIQVRILHDDDVPTVHGFEGDLVAAVLNIVDNAIYWLKISTAEPRELELSFRKTVNYVRLSISNNGPRVDEKSQDRLFEPGFTLKPEGSGNGLAIAREALRYSSWDLAFDSEAENTCFVIEMTRKAGKKND